MSKKPLTITRAGPFEIMLLLGAFLTGLVGMMNPARSSAVLTAYLDGHVWLWHISLMLVAVVTLGGLLLKLPLNLQLERAGMLWLGSVLLAYALAIFLYSGGASVTGGGLSLAFSVASFARVWQITRDLQKLRHAVNHAETITPTLLADPDEAT